MVPGPAARQTGSMPTSSNGHLIDVTLPVAEGIVTFPGDPQYRMSRAAQLSAGDVCNLSRIDCGVHTGTHVDAPLHFLEGGAAVESLPLDALVGPAFVVDAREVTGHIDAATLEALEVPASARRILFRTPNSALWSRNEFVPDFVALAPDAAAVLADRGALLVGNDYLSVAPFGDPAPTHVALLSAGAVILEGLDLRQVEPGWHDVFCLPMPLVGADGAPARTLLRRRDGAPQGG